MTLTDCQMQLLIVSTACVAMRGDHEVGKKTSFATESLMKGRKARMGPTVSWTMEGAWVVAVSAVAAVVTEGEAGIVAVEKEGDMQATT